MKEQLDLLSNLYEKADRAVDNFINISGVACPFGCGTCCEGFVPDILPIEATALAAFISINNINMAYEIAAKGINENVYSSNKTGLFNGCPLYKPDSPYHCSVYEARPLICRMFAFSAVRNKRGEIAFSVCHHGKHAKATRSASGPALLNCFGAEPPLMSDFGLELAMLVPDSASDRKDLPTAIAMAMPRVLFLLGIKNRGPDQDGPGLYPSFPKAG